MQCALAELEQEKYGTVSQKSVESNIMVYIHKSGSSINDFVAVKYIFLINGTLIRMSI